MPNKGLAIPSRVIQGRVRTSDGPEQMAKIILLALSDGDSANPFAGDYGMNLPVFDVMQPATRSLIRREVEIHFDRWEKAGRAKLTKFQMFGSRGQGNLTARGTGSASDAGHFEVRIFYLDLETDTEQQIVKSFKTGGG